MSGSQRMNALTGGHTIIASAAVAELVGLGAGATSGGSSTGAARTPADRPEMRAKDTLG